MFIARSGGAYNRCGSVYDSAASDSTHRIRLIPFTLPQDTNYQLEFGNLYMRVLKDGKPVQTTLKDISAITKATSAVITLKEYSFIKVGATFTVASVLGMTQINGLTGTVSATDGINITCNINSSGFSTYTGGGILTPSSLTDVKFTTTYTEDNLRELTFGQEGSTLTISHQSNYPMQVVYTAPELWTLTQDTTVILPSIAAPVLRSGAIAGWNFICTAASATAAAVYKDVNGASFTIFSTVSGATAFLATGTNTPPASGTLTKFSGTGDATITFTSVAQSSAIGTSWGVTALKRDTFEESLISVWQTSSSTGPQTLTWDPVPGAIQYNVYRGLTPQSLGFAGTIRDTGSTTPGSQARTDAMDVAPDFDTGPPIESLIFSYSSFSPTSNVLPGAIGYFQQRRYWGNLGPPWLGAGPIPAAPSIPPGPNYPDRIIGSRIGSPTYFNASIPTQDDGRLSFRLFHRKPQEIMHFLDIGKMAIFTRQGEWILEGDQNTGGITPSTINPVNVSQNGSGHTAPLAIGQQALYVQWSQILKTAKVRTFGFQIQIEGYSGDDVTVFSNHLVDGHGIVSWAFQRAPHPIVWAVRDDGVLLGLTFVPEQAVLAWHHHDFENGLVEDVIESGDKIYLVIKRTINGSTVRYIEHFSSRQYTEISDAIFADANITVDGRNTDSTKTMTLSGGSTWAYDETLTLTSSASHFTSGSVGKFVHLKDADGNLVRFKIAAYSSGTIVTGNADKTVPADLRAQATSIWADAISVVTGLSHLEGQEVSVLGDGFVVSSPNNDDYPTLTVSSGQITLNNGDVGYSVLQIGLPVTADLETLNLDDPNGPTMLGKKIQITKVDIWFESSRGGWVGGAAPEDDDFDPLDGLERQLNEVKYRYDEGYDEPNKLITRAVPIQIQGSWNSNGRIFIRQVDPLPLGVLAVSPSGYIPGVQ